MKALGVTGGEIDIRPAAQQMLADIGHPFAKGEKVYDVTFENVQAGLRTDYLFRLANQQRRHGGRHRRSLRAGARLVHLRRRRSHVALQPQRLGVEDADPAPDPLRRRVAATSSEETAAILHDILDTEISPELVPAGADGAIQSTEQSVGPYALQDFNLFYLTRYGFRPSKIAFLAWNAWHDVERGAWPANMPAGTRRAYDAGRDQAAGCELFLRRFFAKPVQALGAAQRAEDLVRRLAVAARRLARAVGRQPRRLARRAGHGSSDREIKVAGRRLNAAASPSYILPDREGRNVMADPTLTISSENVCFIIVKAREFDEQDVVTDPEFEFRPHRRRDGRRCSRRIRTMPTLPELRSFINALSDEEQTDLVALMWLGRGDGTLDDWIDLRDEAERQHNSRTAAYLLGEPLLADHLEEGLSSSGFRVRNSKSIVSDPEQREGLPPCAV